MPPGIQDHSFHTQAVFDINNKVGRLETGIENVCQRLTTVETKLDAVKGEISTLNTSIETLRPLIVWVGRSILAFAAFGLTVLGMWIKHHFGW